MAQNPSNQSNRPSSLNEALRILDEALSSPSANIKDIVTDQYQHLKSALGSSGTQAYEQFSSMAEQGIARGRELYSDVDQRVRSNPWPVIGGIAVGTLALGFFLGRGAMSTSVTAEELA
jgi:ElaB/YqjD/DUF883 family membrane-anchored ribosome-binding protein